VTFSGTTNYNISYSGLTSAENAAHVHGPAAQCVNAGIVYPLPAGNPKIGTHTLANDAQVQDMLNGLHYINIHTANFGNGEIRGQILVNSIPAVSDWGVVAMSLLVLTGGSVLFLKRSPL